MTNSQYKSPTHKLINFFKNSRDNWKAKDMEDKKKIRSLTEMLRKLRLRRDELKAENKELRRQLKERDKELQCLANSFPNNSLKKREPVIIKQNRAQIQPNSNAETSLKPTNHHYNANVISMASELVTKACSSFRAGGKSLKVINKYLPIETPSTASNRQWVYRLGYYELIEQLSFKRAHFKRANWVLIADFTAQIGTHKCFIVLGIRLDKLKSCQWHLSHQDVTLLGLELWEHPSVQKVFQYLERISTQIGVPVQIVADGASDFHCGINLLALSHFEWVI